MTYIRVTVTIFPYLILKKTYRNCYSNFPEICQSSSLAYGCHLYDSLLLVLFTSFSLFSYPTRLRIQSWLLCTVLYFCSREFFSQYNVFTFQIRETPLSDLREYFSLQNIFLKCFFFHSSQHSVQSAGNPQCLSILSWPFSWDIL